MHSLPYQTDQQSAVRLLACICAAVEPVEGFESWPEAVGILRAQSRLQALDFWIRYPDYLANELLNEFEKGGSTEDLELARKIFDDREPDLRRVPMVRYHFGAFEPVHNPLSILRSRDLVRQIVSGQPGNVRETWYLLTRLGSESMDCPSSEPLGHSRAIPKGGSGSSWFGFTPRPAGAASGASGWSFP